MADKENKRSQFVERLILFIVFLIFAGLIVAYTLASNYVPVSDSKGKVTSFQFTTSEKVSLLPAVSDSLLEGSGSDTSGDGTKAEVQGVTGQININTATASELDSLPGIGPAKADAIIKYRETESRFYYIEDIMNVSGIGEKIFEQIKDMICVE